MTRPTCRHEPAVALLDILQTDAPLPSDVIRDVPFLTPNGSRVSARYLQMQPADKSSPSSIVSRWSEARRRFAEGHEVTAINVTYESTNASDAFAADDLAVPLWYVHQSRVTPEDIGYHFIQRIADEPREVSLEEVGYRLVCLHSPRSQHACYLSASEVYSVTDEDLQTLACHLAQMKAARDAIESWWATRRTVAQCAQDIRRQRGDPPDPWALPPEPSAGCR